MKWPKVLVPHSRPIYTAAYTAMIVMGVGFLIGSSPTLATLLHPPFLLVWHIVTIIGGTIAITGRWMRNARVEIAGLSSALSALLAYAAVLSLAVHDSGNPATIVGLVGLALFAAGMTLGRIGTLSDDLRTVSRLDAAGK